MDWSAKSTVETVAFLDGEDLGKGVLLLENEGFSWTGANSDPLMVKYSQIMKYGSPILGHPPTNELFVSYNTDEKETRSIRLRFKSVSLLSGVMNTLLEFADLDPDHSIFPSTVAKLTCDENVRATFGGGPEIATSVLKTQVTCILFKGDVLLAGVGDSFHVFEKEICSNKWTLSAKRQLFEGQHIHGIVDGEANNIIAFGGRKIGYVRHYCSSGSCRIRLLYTFRAPDWILSCSWVESNSHIALLTANNSIVLYHLSTCVPNFISISYCAERCILYSGTILGNTWDSIIVLAGTVFSTIAIWSNAGNSQSKKVIHHLKGHKGVIFSIAYCYKSKRISSTSDDRSVCVWDVEFEELDNWETSTITLKLSLFGHSARVWKSSLLEDGKIVSVGEDSRICLWNSDGTLANQYSGHQGGEIWSMDVSEESRLIATGGSDGGISFWPIRKEPVPMELKLDKLDHQKPKCVGLLEDGRPFLVSWTGDVFLFVESCWKSCLSLPELNNYCLHSVSPNRKLIAFASINGRIIICSYSDLSLHKVIDVSVCSGRIFSVLWLSDYSIVVCESAGNFSLWKMLMKTELLEKEAEFILPHSKERWITSCASDGFYLVCGDRCGSLHLYAQKGESKEPVYSAKKIHGHSGVTNVLFLEGKFLSTGRDGKYREFLVEHDKLVLSLCCKLKIDWVAAVRNSTLLGRILFCFHEIFFVIWSINERRSIVRIDCGGGHRSWDCLINSEQNKIFVTYIKGKTVNYCCIPDVDMICHTLVPGSHPKAINSAELIPVRVQSAAAQEKRLILLGGEDTTLRVVSVELGTQTDLRVLESHLSSVRAVDCYRTDSSTIYIVSGGGRGQLILWRAYHLDRQQSLLDVVEISSYSINPLGKSGFINDDAEMRIMDLKMYQQSCKSVFIAAGCSDGVLRIFEFFFDSNNFSKVQEFNYEQCLLKVCVTDSVNDRMLITATTNGVLCFHSINGLGVLMKEQNDLRVSETGINSCDYAFVDGCLILSSAGDDAQVNIVLVNRTSSNSSFEMLDKWVCDSAHTCQISGLKMVNNYVFTAGLDQKLSIFSWKITGSQIIANLITRVELSIPDIHGVLVWPSSEEKSYCIFVYGLGTQLINFTS